MKMPTENQMHSQLPELVEKKLVSWKNRVRSTIRRRGQSMMHDYDTDIRTRCFLEDACQKTELAILDASVDESSMGINRVQGHENSPVHSGYGVEFLGYERPIVPKWSEQPLI